MPSAPPWSYRKQNHRGTENAESHREGSGSKGSSNRVNRGGSFDNAASNARSANRNNDTPENADNNLGCRPAKASHRPIAALYQTAAPRP